MDTLKAFKHSAELREYWRLEKRKQRAPFDNCSIHCNCCVASSATFAKSKNPTFDQKPKRMMLSLTQIDKQKRDFVAVGSQSHTLNSANDHLKAVQIMAWKGRIDKYECESEK